MIFWKVESKVPPFNPYFVTWPLGHCATCNRSSYTKNEYNFFYQKLDVEQFFRKKKHYFLENGKNLFWEHISQFFRERKRLAPKINIPFVITNEVLNILLLNGFFKKVVFSEKTVKNHFWRPSLFWRIGGVWQRRCI